MKLLITADLHISDYPNHNLFRDPLFRLHQFNRLSDRLIEIHKEEKCQGIIIAGDLLNVASPRPYVVNEIYNFLKKLNNLEVPIFLCHGQHDLDTRGTISVSDTLLTVFNEFSNVKYLHKEFITLDKRSLYFYGWEPKFTLPESIKGDVLIGHHTVSNVKIGQAEVVFKGNEDVNANGFKIAFLGDIHRHQTKKNMVCIGAPIQGSFSDHPDTGVIILDLETLEWYRVLTETENAKFLKFLITDDEIKDEWVVTSPLTKKRTQSVEIIKEKTLRIEDYIDSGIKKAGLENVHKLIRPRVSEENIKEINLDFSIEGITIKNFRSISDFDAEISPGTKLIIGENGSGKSSLLEAINFGLTGEGNARSFVKTGEKEMYVYIDLIYQENSYRIERGWNEKGWIKYYVNNIEQKAENQNQIKEKISKDLEFLELIDLFIHLQNRVGFLSSYAFKERVDLMNKILGVQIVGACYSSSLIFFEELEEKVNKIKEENLGFSNTIEQIGEIDFTSLEVDYEREINQLKKDKESYSKMISIVNKIINLKREIKQSEIILSEQTKIQCLTNEELETEKQTIFNLKSQGKKAQEDFRKETEIIGKANSRKSFIESEINKTKESMNKAMTELKSLKNKLCYACGQNIDSLIMKEMTEKHLQDIDNSTRIIGDLKGERDALLEKIKLSDLKSLEETYLEFTRNIAKLEEEKKNNEKLMVLAFSQEKGAEKHNKLIQELNKFVTQEESFISIFTGIREEKFTPSTIYQQELQETLEFFISEISKLETERENSKHLLKLKRKVEEAKIGFETTSIFLSLTQGEIEKVKSYNDLMSPKGSIMVSFLSDVSSLISTDTVQMKSYKKLVGGEYRPDLSADMKVGETWQPYENLSGGQKTVVDLTVLNKLLHLTGGFSGLMMFDETFKFLDSKNTEIAVDQLKDLNCRSIFIVSHLDNFPFYDQIIKAEIDNKGNSFFSI